MIPPGWVSGPRPEVVRVGPPCVVQLWGDVRGADDWSYCHKPTPLTGALIVLDFPVCDECAAMIKEPIR